MDRHLFGFINCMRAVHNFEEMINGHENGKLRNTDTFNNTTTCHISFNSLSPSSDAILIKGA